ncbi:neurotrophin 1-like [Cherax quadricarinatus]|uniref:neurotrophin 1-like n=1 Tax=Cherax quadricarinatus TaxID=27406 RepID=UPI002378668B|nr:uncharacterized protein LOC128689645 [Cherax quadricarinatus]
MAFVTATSDPSVYFPPTLPYLQHINHSHPTYYPQPTYHQQPTLAPQLPYNGHPVIVPSCAANTTKTWCIEDTEYPTYEVQNALQLHHFLFTTLYADWAALETNVSVARPKNNQAETYLCPSENIYVKPLRAQNTEGVWRVIVNDIKVNYETYTQTTRLEECMTPSENCPLVPLCYESKCLQKFTYQRLLIYDPHDQHFPFAINTFKLPASCVCLLDNFTLYKETT